MIEIAMKLIDKELYNNPYIFIKHMLYIDQGLEKYDSRKNIESYLFNVINLKTMTR